MSGWISIPVTNADFTLFVDDTGYKTIVERVPNGAQYTGALPHMLVAGSVVFRQPGRSVDLRNHYNWWTYTQPATRDR